MPGPLVRRVAALLVMTAFVLGWRARAQAPDHEPTARLEVAAGPTAPLHVAGPTARLEAAAGPTAPARQSTEARRGTDTKTATVVMPPCRHDADACVDATHKLAWLLDDGLVYYGPVPVELGRPGHPTPTGRFRVQWKDRSHTSDGYGLKMDFAVFFAAGGIAFHEGPLDTPSHGCVHLRHPDAAKFFDTLEVGARVQVMAA